MSDDTLVIGGGIAALLVVMLALSHGAASAAPLVSGTIVPSDPGLDAISQAEIAAKGNAFGALANALTQSHLADTTAATDVALANVNAGTQRAQIAAQRYQAELTARVAQGQTAAERQKTTTGFWSGLARDIGSLFGL